MHCWPVIHSFQQRVSWKRFAAALKLRSRVRAHDIEEAFDGLGEEARKFHLELRRLPVKTSVHLRRLLNLVHLYGRQDVVAAIARANQWLTFDAAYVETILLQDRRRGRTCVGDGSSRRRRSCSRMVST